MANFKKVLALALSAAMVLTAAPLTSTTANAAAKVKLSATKGTIKVGKTKKVTIKGTKKSNIKSVKFTYSNTKKRVTVKRSGLTIKITGKKKGTVTVKAKVTLKKAVGGKKVWNLKYKATVKKASTTPVVEEIKTTAITLDQATATVVAGDTVTLTATKTPADSTEAIEWSSDKPEVATVTAGVVTGVAEGEAVITAKSGDASATCVVTVTKKEVIAQLTNAAQTKANEVKLTFDIDTKTATTAVNKDDIIVELADETQVIPINKLTFSADGKEAIALLNAAVSDAKEYKVVYKNSSASFVASVGKVASVVINTVSAEENVKTKIDFALMDAKGVDVTSTVKVDETVTVSVDGKYAAAELSKASEASITMDAVGDQATVTVKYNSNETGAQDITATQTVNCIDAKATVGTKLFAQTTSVNGNSKCAKFYNGLSSSSVTVEVDKTADNIYFCALDENGDPISYDEYEVESSNDDVVSATTTEYTSGKFTQISITGNKVASANLNVKATKNNKPTFYTIPVSVVKEAEPASVKVDLSRTTMSNAYDPAYGGEISVTVLDASQNETSEYESVKIEIADEKYYDAKYIDSDAAAVLEGLATGFVVEQTGRTAKGTYTAYGAKSGSYPIKVTVTKKDGKEISRTQNVKVEAISKSAYNDTGIKVTYGIEFTKGSALDAAKGDATEARLVAKDGTKFAGYVRIDGDDTVLGGFEHLNAAEAVGAKYEKNGKFSLTGATGADREPALLNGVKVVWADGTAVSRETLSGLETLEAVTAFTGELPAKAVLTKVEGVYTLTLTPGQENVTWDEGENKAVGGAVKAWAKADIDAALAGATTALTGEEATATLGEIKAVTASEAALNDAEKTSDVFAGGHGTIEAGDYSYINVKDESRIWSVTAGARFGKIYTAGNLFALDKTNTDTFGLTNGEIAKVTLASRNVIGDDGFYEYVSGDATKDVDYARPGTYTVVFKYHDKDHKVDKFAESTNGVTVKNSLVAPKVTVTNRTVESTNASDIVKVLKANVDMNNNESDYASIRDDAVFKGVAPEAGTPGIFAEAADENGKITVKYVAVMEDSVLFYVPINATFKAA